MSLFDNYTRKQKQVLKEQLVNQLFWSKLYEKEHDTNPDALMKKLKAMSFRKIVDKWEEDLRLITQKEYD